MEELEVHPSPPTNCCCRRRRRSLLLLLLPIIIIIIKQTYIPRSAKSASGSLLPWYCRFSPAKKRFEFALESVA